MDAEAVVQTPAPQKLEPWQAAIERRLAAGSERMQALERGQEALQHGQEALKTDVEANTRITTEIRDLLQMGRNGLRILGYLGASAKWAASIIAACGAAWGLVTTSRPQPAPPAPTPVAAAVEPAREPAAKQGGR